MLPNFIIAGATRSGTTSLYYYLKQHPEISFPNLKEPRYFSSYNLTLPQHGPGDHTVDEKLITMFEDYEKLYKNVENNRVGDASSEYLYHFETSADKIKDTLGDIPIIIILRNPAERAYSAYNNLVRDGRETESFEGALKLEQKRKLENWDMMWAYKSVGMYTNQVKKYLETFSKIKVLIFEEFVKDPHEGLKEICRFLDVDDSFQFDVDTKYSHSGEAKNKFIAWTTSRNNPVFYPIRKTIFKIIPRKYLEKIAIRLYGKSELKPEYVKQLFLEYSEDIRELEKLLKTDLAIWKN